MKNLDNFKVTKILNKNFDGIALYCKLCESASPVGVIIELPKLNELAKEHKKNCDALKRKPKMGPKHRMEKTERYDVT